MNLDGGVGADRIRAISQNKVQLGSRLSHLSSLTTNMKDKAFPSCAPSASPWIVQEQRVDVNVGLSLTNSVLEQEPENTGNRCF